MTARFFGLTAALLILAMFVAGCRSEPAVLPDQTRQLLPEPAQEPAPAQDPEREAFISACRAGARAWVEQMEVIHGNWLTGMNKAGSTSPAQLSLALVDLRRANRDAEQVEPPACIAAIHQGYIAGQDTFVQFFFDLLDDPRMDLAPYAEQIEEAQFQIMSLEFALEIYHDSADTFAEGLWEDRVYQEQQSGAQP
jgi:hypothetical protein